MRFSYRWLKEFVDIDWTPKELADRLTMAGLEVDSVEKIETFGSVVGEVKNIKKHENLLVCETDIGDKKIIIVTADSSVKIGEKFPVILAGGKLSDRVIDRREFGKYTSEGMFLSAEELGLEDSSSELLRLDTSFKNGQPLNDIDEFDDYVIEIEFTPNRADALSILGIARDVKALSGKEIKLPANSYSAIDKKINDFIDVEIKDYENCPRYSLHLAEIEVNPAPFFMRMRLLKSGIRAINNIVDITNYVLMAFGQPMHAFDFNKIDGNIIVRKAKDGEKIVALDGKEYKLDNSMLVIADEKAPIAIAGVMGGEFSSVDENTKLVALESAFFNPISVRLTARKLKLHTESSHRFERGVDPNLCVEAAKYALNLMEKYASAKVYLGFIDNKLGEFEKKEVVVSFDGINRLLGSSYTSNEIVDVLVGLNMDVENVGSGKIKLKAPTYRFDIENEADIAEEVARIKGYDTIEPTYPTVETRFKVKDKVEQASEEVVKTLANVGLFETNNYSFVDDKRLILFDKDKDNFVYLKNPLIDSQNVMRTNLAVSLMDTLVFNITKGARSVPIFEVGRVFFKDNDFAREFVRVGFLLWGLRDFSWHEKGNYFDFYDIKGVSEAVGGVLGVEFDYVPTKEQFLHPKRGADLLLNDKKVGYVGELHPDLYKEYDLKFEKRNRVLVGEIDLTVAVGLLREKVMYEQLPKLPTVWRDLAIIVDKGVRWIDIEKEIRCIESVYRVVLFDVYDKLEEKGKVSLAFRIILKRDDRTFTEEEIGEILNLIYDRLKDKFNARLRGE